MLTLHDPPDGGRLSRRGFLQIGASGLAGLTLADLLRAESQPGARSTGKSVINIMLYGGPSHLDTFDPKPDAPREVRGEFQPIRTCVPGLEICELMPRLAGVADRITVIRSIVGMVDEHLNRQADSGWPSRSLASIGGRPGIGAVLSKLMGPAQNVAGGTAPTFVELERSAAEDRQRSTPGFLGPTFQAFRPDGQGLGDLSLQASVGADRFAARRTLLGHLDRIRRDVDGRGLMDAMDSFSQRSFGIVTSGRIATALDLKKERPEIVQRYGASSGHNRKFLQARRLLEAGVRCVTFNTTGWDTHDTNFPRLRSMVPELDQSLSALIEDLQQRGMLDDTIIMMSGEFGRTPRINATAGRDHWPQASFFVLAGGGLRHGQVIGSTNRLGEAPLLRPIHQQRVFATVYRQLGIDPRRTTLIDPNGRPQYLLDHHESISELV